YDTSAVPIPSCSCMSDEVTYTLHAPRAGQILWWLGSKRAGSNHVEEHAVKRSVGWPALPPPEGSRMLIACDRGVIVFIREDRAGAWRVPEHGDIRSLWYKKKLPQPMDTTSIDAPAVEGATVKHVGCASATIVNGKVDLPLQGGKHVAIDFADGGL
ncbi:MAG TPA: hypothetical protein VGH87_11560, partial [Polyangiaceae bacterium]